MQEPTDFHWQAIKNLRATDNPLSVEKVKCEIQNLLKKLFTFFGAVNQSRVEEWSRLAANMGYSPFEVFQACEKIVLLEDRITSFKLLKTYLGMVTTKDEKEAEKEDLDLKKAETLRKDSAMYKAMFLEKYGQEKLTKIFHQWWSGIYGGDPGSYGLGLEVFYPIFFQDLIKVKKDLGDKKHSLEELINKAIERGKNEMGSH